MTKKIVFFISIICIILLLYYIIFIYYNNRRIKTLSRLMNIELKGCTIESEEDNHGGFLGDGDCCVKVKCSDKVDQEIKAKWKELPFSEELQRIMNMYQYDSKGEYDAYSKYNIPRLESGYYYFYDRHSQANNKNDETVINNRSSYNFSLGIYDDSTKTLYYYELDT